MSDIKKKKFSFFDLSDDDSFNNVTHEKKELNEREEQQVFNTQNHIEEEKKENIHEFETNKNEQIQEQQIVKQQENFYGKVEAFVPSKKEVITEQEHKEIVPEVNEKQNVQEQEFKPNIQTQHENTINKTIPKHETNISNESLNGFFDVKEKLDVKTNIYIKK